MRPAWETNYALVQPLELDIHDGDYLANSINDWVARAAMKYANSTLSDQPKPNRHRLL